jgi:hypothetical protein
LANCNPHFNRIKNGFYYKCSEAPQYQDSLDNLQRHLLQYQGFYFKIGISSFLKLLKTKFSRGISGAYRLFLPSAL